MGQVLYTGDLGVLYKPVLILLAMRPELLGYLYHTVQICRIAWLICIPKQRNMISFGLPLLPIIPITVDD